MRQAPDFRLQDQKGDWKSLKDFAGGWLVLYFYPRDNTPGCTTEACNFRDERNAIKQLGKAEVVGVSKDSVATHANFAKKHDLNFPLLSDPDHKMIEAYGSWGEKKFMGRVFMGIRRDTYLINPEGQIVKEYRDVNPRKHAAEIIADLHQLQSG